MGILSRIFRTENILYYPGCLTKFVGKEIEENYREILGKAGVDFIQLKDAELCCGSPVLNSGHEKEAKVIAEKNFRLFKEQGITKIITACPACYKTFSNDYPKLVPGWDIKAEHMSVTIARAIKKGKIKPEENSLEVTYHDPCHLGRHMKIYEEPRDIIRSTGAKIREMKLTRENAVCCGGGAGVRSNYPKLAASIGKERIQMARETGAKVLVTACPMCYFNLKENAHGFEVMELSQIILNKKK
ncbi:MAG: (Fe-S)-binding protein [Candidatus Woesearchaeota archaeon]|nr:(Fe-S)-binding protein [Candidatus Woesearchaeota archaeon]